MKNEDFHPAVRDIISHFDSSHLKPPLAEMSNKFGRLARELATDHPQSRETSVALRKLLEAKDAAVRAVLESERRREKEPPEPEAA